MIRASKAREIGEKLYNMERIHGKVVSFTHQKSNPFGTNSIQIEEFRNFLLNLKTLVDCMAKDISGKYVLKYKQAIDQAISKSNSSNSIINHDLFLSCCYLHGSFAKFRKKVARLINRGCEIDFQNVCLPLIIVELERKKLKTVQNIA
jgi:hypothetical protein